MKRGKQGRLLLPEARKAGLLGGPLTVPDGVECASQIPRGHPDPPLGILERQPSPGAPEIRSPRCMQARPWLPPTQALFPVIGPPSPPPQGQGWWQGWLQALVIRRAWELPHSCLGGRGKGPKVKCTKKHVATLSATQAPEQPLPVTHLRALPRPDPLPGPFLLAHRSRA